MRRSSGPVEHAELGVTLPPGVTGGFIVVPVEPVEDEAHHAFPEALPSPLPAKMAYEILEGEYEAMREAHDRMCAALEVMKQTLKDAQTRVAPIF